MDLQQTKADCHFMPELGQQNDKRVECELVAVVQVTQRYEKLRVISAAELEQPYCAQWYNLMSHPFEVVSATHNFKWVKNIHICLIWYQAFVIAYVLLFSAQIPH